MITNSFDPASPAVFSTEDLFDKVQPMADVCIVTFSKTLADHVLAHFPCDTLAILPGLNGDLPVCLLKDQAPRIAFYMSPITAAGAGIKMEEAAAATGVRRFVLFGSCGALDSALTEGRLIPHRSLPGRGPATTRARRPYIR